MGKTIAVFHFRYRSSGKLSASKASPSESNISSAALKSLQIIPHTPSPSPRQEVPGAMSGMSRAMAQPTEPTIQQNNEVKTEGVKREAAASLKREADQVKEEDEVQFVSSKRVRKSPTHRDEVVVLD
jgi:hypothetical protein